MLKNQNCFTAVFFVATNCHNFEVHIMSSMAAVVRVVNYGRRHTYSGSTLTLHILLLIVFWCKTIFFNFLFVFLTIITYDLKVFLNLLAGKREKNIKCEIGYIAFIPLWLFLLQSTIL